MRCPSLPWFSLFVVTLTALLACAMEDRDDVLAMKACPDGRCARGYTCISGVCTRDPANQQQSIPLQHPDPETSADAGTALEGE